jgi:hypothetical protein
MLAKNPESRPSSADLPAIMSRLANDPYRGGAPRVSLPPLHASNPFSGAEAHEAVRSVIRGGRDASYVGRLLSVLQARPRGVEVRSSHPADALMLLDVAREASDDRRDLVARITLPKPAMHLRDAIHRKLGLPPTDSIEDASSELFASVRSIDHNGVLEIYAPLGLSPRQRAEIDVLADAARVRGIVCAVATSPAAQPQAAGSDDAESLDGFVCIEAIVAGESQPEMQERLRLWIETATGGRFRFSPDGLRLAGHACCEGGRWWARVGCDSLLIAAAARLPVVTTWAVLGATTAQGGHWHDVHDVPPEWRRRPFVWPPEDLLQQLVRLRAAESPDRPRCEPT